MRKAYNPNDVLAQRAKAQGYRARSVYKLVELDQKFHLLRPDLCVLDVGAAPGAWLQYVSTQVGQEGKVTGIDQKIIEPVAENVQTQVGDILDSNLTFEMVDLILSDLAPNTSGMSDSDHIKSIQLDEAVLGVARKYLIKNGNLVMKVFPGRNLQSFVQKLKKHFLVVKQVKVRASRQRSREYYLVCLNKKDH